MTLLNLLRARAEEAVDFALVNGLVKRNPEGGVVHAPFALTPCPIHSATERRLAALTPPFNRLAHAVSRHLDFLEEGLGPAARADSFTRGLLRLARATAGRQPLQLQIVRSDYLLQGAAGRARPLVRQVELNTMAASYAALAAKTSLLHRYLLAGTPWADRLVRNDPLPAIADGFAEAFSRYGHPAAITVMIVRKGENNLFDQRLLEFALGQRGVPMRRMTLAEVQARGRLREGHLRIDGRIAAIVYFRAGYRPADLRASAARKGRELIARSSAISVPDVSLQLAGTKKVQQLLAEPRTLRKFASEADARLMESTFAPLYGLEDSLLTEDGPLPAWRAALADPERYVLKPQREGGGNNLYDRQLAQRLRGSTLRDRQTFILMERIRPLSHRALTVREGRVRDAICNSEIGRFGLLLADGATHLLNRDTGYLVRTKAATVLEAGVSAGFGHLNSLIRTEGDPVK